MTGAPSAGGQGVVITVTANPSIDVTASLAEPLSRGAVHRLGPAIREPGGKGINVSRVLQGAGVHTVALLLADDHDEMVAMLRDLGVPHRTIGTGTPVRNNLALVEPGGTTTKLNQSGAEVPPRALARLGRAAVDAASSADWMVLSGSLPPGAPTDWYARIAGRLADAPPRVAIDTSGPALAALLPHLAGGCVDLLKPNIDELATLVGIDAGSVQEAVDLGDWTPALRAAGRLVQLGAGRVLLTLGSAGAALVTRCGSWVAKPPATTVVSTVGAGDAALAGYLIAETRGCDESDCLRAAVAHGSVAASLPGTHPPTPELVRRAGHVDVVHAGRER